MDSFLFSFFGAMLFYAFIYLRYIFVHIVFVVFSGALYT